MDTRSQHATRRRWAAVVLLATALGTAAEAAADVAEIEPARDATLYEHPQGLLANGAGDHLFTGINADGRIRRTLLAFDVAAEIPAGARIEAVVLTLYVSRVRTLAGADVSLHRARSDWGEGDSHAPAREGGGAEPPAPADATWLHAFYDTQLWAVPGGDFEEPARAVTRVERSDRGYAWSSALLVEDVQLWLDDPSSNLGWFLLGDEREGRRATSKRFDSRENAVPAQRPVLSVLYTPPAGACGDVNGDGRVDTIDARLVQRCDAGGIRCSERCDTNGNGICDLDDARRIQEFVVGRLDAFGLVCGSP